MIAIKAKLSVMLVEDDPAHAEITLRCIEELAPKLCDIVHLLDAEAALDHLRRVRVDASTKLPDLMLLDLRLPRFSGLELLALVKSDAELKTVPVVVLTTSDADGDRNEAMALGANSYLVKPIGEPELLALARVLGCQDFCQQRTAFA